MENQEATQTQETPAPAGLSLQDLNALAMIVAAACKRGSFEAKEMSTVGLVYDRLVAFLTASNPKPEGEAAPAEGNSATAETPAE